MASFGRKPQKTGGLSASSRRSAEENKERSEGFRKLMEEEEERKRFAQDFEERASREQRTQEEEAATARKARQEEKAALEAQKGLPNPVVYLDVEVCGQASFASGKGQVVASGRLEIELFADVVPRTAENFRCLCTGEKGRKLHFKESAFHRIIPDFMAQGGDITNGDGTGGLSIYGQNFADESMTRLHARANLLSMANSGPNTNNSQFFILFKQAKHLDRKHVVFGEIVREDGGVMKAIQAAGSASGDVHGSVVIKNCGQLKTAQDEENSRNRFRRSRSRSTKRPVQKCLSRGGL
eukprot:TRINITY_DN74108_c0_g1_i1.p1 TRINITY_DN74108_c0_g1~~TRINITY_DN74108_c0_g1_i1.p1  ORF type:complete len:303 (-),score=53.75 TRINITY_DN74108_c0_g1_i1:79-966(-)